MEEEWRDVVGQYGRYQVSNKENVRSLLRRPEGEEHTVKRVSLYGGKRVVYLMTHGKSTRKRVDLLARQAFSATETDNAEGADYALALSSSAEQAAMRIVLALKKLGPVLDLTDTKQALYACSRIKELLTGRQV